MYISSLYIHVHVHPHLKPSHHSHLSLSLSLEIQIQLFNQFYIFSDFPKMRITYTYTTTIKSKKEGRRYEEDGTREQWEWINKIRTKSELLKLSFSGFHWHWLWAFKSDYYVMAELRTNSSMGRERKYSFPIKLGFWYDRNCKKLRKEMIVCVLKTVMLHRGLQDFGMRADHFFHAYAVFVNYDCWYSPHILRVCYSWALFHIHLLLF